MYHNLDKFTVYVDIFKVPSNWIFNRNIFGYNNSNNNQKKKWLGKSVTATVTTRSHRLNLLVVMKEICTDSASSLSLLCWAWRDWWYWESYQIPASFNFIQFSEKANIWKWNYNSGTIELHFGAVNWMVSHWFCLESQCHVRKSRSANLLYCTGIKWRQNMSNNMQH